MKLLAIDAALNHTALMIFNNNEFKRYKLIIAPKKINTKKYKENNDVYDMRRLNYLVNEFDNFIVNNLDIKYVIIEDYAYSSKSASLYQIGGWVEYIKHKLYNLLIPYRLIDPMSVKLFATNNGHADKNDIIFEVKHNWERIDFQNMIYKNKKIKKEELKYIEDLNDAYVLGRILYTELMLRKGEIILKDLKEQEIKIFNRVTKTRPINILACDFVKKNN